MKYKLKVYSIWEYGQRVDKEGNPHQEDSMYPPYGREKDSDRLFILCDGMGGHDAGEVASTTVCEAMSESILNDGHDKEGLFTAEDFDRALDAAFKALDAKDTGASKKMGTTMTFLKLHNQGASIAHMGDSRVYHIRPGKTGEDTIILHETSDHSLVNDLVKAGEMSRAEARASNQKNIITRAMQPGMDRRPKADRYSTTDIRPGDYFYLCSDGMLEQPDMEDGTSLRNVFSERGGDDRNKIQILKAVTENNRDNHTAIIVHILDVFDDKDPEKFTAILDDESLPEDKELSETKEKVKENDAKTPSWESYNLEEEKIPEGKKTDKVDKGEIADKDVDEKKEDKVVGKRIFPLFMSSRSMGWRVFIGGIIVLVAILVTLWLISLFFDFADEAHPSPPTPQETTLSTP